MTKNEKIILMVDDDAEDRLLLKDAFDDLNYGGSIHFEDNGEKAISYLRECTELDCIPRLVVLDLNMPKLNGRQTLKWIKSEPVLRDLPVVIYSTSLNPIEKEECLALGAHSYVIKPISYKESITIAENFLSLTAVNNVPE
jgi:two-component system response regulator